MSKIVKESKETINVVKDLNLLEKINAIRKAWGESDIAKDGKGKAGGSAKYDYYKPQQIIEFTLEQELAHGLFSEFSVTLDRDCFYSITDISTGEVKSVTCPFAIPSKMAASEAQQVGAAMTYHNRRLAMMMYKIEDNSKENESVLGDADYTAVNIPAPPMPTAPIIVPPPVMAPTTTPPAPPSVVVSESEKLEEQIAESNIEASKVVNVPAEIEQEVGNTESTDAQVDELVNAQAKATENPIKYISPSDVMSGKAGNAQSAYIPPMPPGAPLSGIASSAQTPPITPPTTPPITPPVSKPVNKSKKSIEALYD